MTVPSLARRVTLPAVLDVLAVVVFIGTLAQGVIGLARMSAIEDGSALATFVAYLLTHGHVDHVYSVTPVCGGELAAYIHTDDRYRLRDPLADSSLGPALAGMLEQQFGRAATWMAERAGGFSLKNSA